MLIPIPHLTPNERTNNPEGTLTLYCGTGMCGAKDPLLKRLWQFQRTPFEAYFSSQDPILRNFLPRFDFLSSEYPIFNKKLQKLGLKDKNVL